MSLLDNAFGISAQALAFRSQRSSVLAANIANAETPQYFARGKAWAFKSVRRAITVDRSGRIAWFDEDLATQSLGPARGSGVMVRAADATWKIAQYNLAITVPNQRFVEVKDLLASPPGAAPAATSSEAVPATSADAGQPTSADAGPRPPIKK